MAILPAIVCVVIMMVNGNIGAGVAVAGAFSLVRFRSVPGTAREIGAIFLAMGTGLICGMGYLGHAALSKKANDIPDTNLTRDCSFRGFGHEDIIPQIQIRRESGQSTESDGV